MEGRNLTFHYEDWTADFRSRVTQVDFDREVEAERQAAAALGYTQHPPKLCLSHYLEQKLEDENGTPSSSLHLTFGQSGYLEHRVYRKEAEKNKGEQDAFRNIILAPKGNNSYFYQCPWAACGGGTWVVTRDHYLAVSFRTRVAEESGKLGYSSSGSYGRYTAEAGERKDNTPGLAMCKELAEEIGLIDLVPGDLTLISLGIDLNRYLIQFSYRLESPLTAQQLADRRAEWATTADEQILFFVPLERPDAALALLTQCEFEPGAAYSLYRLLQKRFGAL